MGLLDVAGAADDGGDAVVVEDACFGAERHGMLGICVGAAHDRLAGGFGSGGEGDAGHGGHGTGGDGGFGEAYAHLGL